MPEREWQTSAPVAWAPRATWLRPELTRWRVTLALLVAVTADAIQIVLGPVGWFLSDEVVDVATMDRLEFVKLLLKLEQTFGG